MKNIEKEFFNKMDKIILETVDYHEKTEFVRNFFKKELEIDDIDESEINLGRMKTKTFFYLLLSLIVEYGKMVESHEEYIQDFFSSGDSKTGNDGNQDYKKKTVAEIDINSKKAYYLSVGKIDPSRFNIKGEEISYYRSEMERIGVDLGKDAFIIFQPQDKELIFNLISDIIADYEGDN